MRLRVIFEDGFVDGVWVVAVEPVDEVGMVGVLGDSQGFERAIESQDLSRADLFGLEAR